MPFFRNSPCSARSSSYFIGARLNKTQFQYTMNDADSGELNHWAGMFLDKIKTLPTVADVTTMQPRYVELLSDALKVTPSDTDYLDDVDQGFYSSEYLRAWAFEAQLRGYLRERFGNAWFTRREAGSLLRELWNEGQKPTADEILAETSGDRLQLEAVADRIREAL